MHEPDAHHVAITASYPSTPPGPHDVVKDILGAIPAPTPAVTQQIADQRSELAEHRAFDVTVSCFVDRLIEETDCLDGFIKQYSTKKWRRTKRDNEMFESARAGLHERVALDAMLAAYFDYRCTASEEQPIWRDFPEKANHRKIASEMHKALLKTGRALRSRGLALVEAISALRPAGGTVDNLLRQLQAEPVQRLAVPARRRARTPLKSRKAMQTQDQEIASITIFIQREAGIRRKLKTVLRDTAVREAASKAPDMKLILGVMEAQLKDRNDLALDVKVYKDERDCIGRLQIKFDNSIKSADRYSKANMRLEMEEAHKCHAVRRRNLALRIEKTMAVDIEAINRMMLLEPGRYG